MPAVVGVRHRQGLDFVLVALRAVPQVVVDLGEMPEQDNQARSTTVNIDRTPGASPTKP